ncbi:hypothetical protein [Phytohabitans kaempferiae]|uniref:PPE family domain-containing protein n=1 Tax=Phytohabitans kaempferiae TaxID=1620943 RepID=A0ABV6M0M4_9ACTN
MTWERSGVPYARPGTSWFDREVPAMWHALENQQSDDHWRLVAGWRKASELTATHLRRLEQYRANLAEAWPPDRNAAAAAYVARLDFLIDNVRTTHEVAAANYSTLAATVGALATARRELRPLYDEYMSTARAIKDHAETVAFNRSAEVATVISAAPASAQDLERLNNRARSIMYVLSHTLVEAKAAIRQPPTYQPRTERDGGDPDAYGNASTESAGTRSPTSASSAQTSSQRLPDTDIRGNLPTQDSSPPLAPVPTPPANGGLIGLPPGSVLPGRTGQGGGSGLATTPNSTRIRAAAPLPPGGVIGPAPGTERMEGSRGPRPNPVGGLVGGQRPLGSRFDHGSIVQPIYGPIGATSSSRERVIPRRHSDTSWEIEKGVPPIIEPRTEADHINPGPVIGLDPWR